MADQENKEQGGDAPAAVPAAATAAAPDAATAAAAGGEKSERKRASKKAKKTIWAGTVYIQASFNNTIITVTDPQGAVVCWSSAGAKGFKGSRKSTPFAAQIAAEDAARKAMEHGMRSVSIFVNGPGAGREAALRAIQIAGLKVQMIRDVTPIPHNGCRPPKRRRV